MRYLTSLGLDILQTLLRLFPFPCKTGLVKIGEPGRDAPVLLTGNFRLTVERVRRAMQGLDAYLLVANSRGVNVWCAATGGLLTDRDVVSALKTSGIEDLVDHRQVILPQLAATGVEGNVVHSKSGWKVIWGPVYARAIPAFLRAGLRATRGMRTVRFPWSQRLEMAIAWAFPISLVAIVLLPFWPQGIIPLVALVWGSALLVFLTFPLYRDSLRSTRGRVAVPIVAWLLFIAALLVGAVWADTLSGSLLLRWAAIWLVVILIVTVDLTGSTPIYKGGLQEDRKLRIVLETELCKGAAFCEHVCPTDVFKVDHQRRMATLARPEACTQCGACIVQCPFDALHFRTAAGDVVTPDTVRRFKLNLLGRRLVRATDAPGPQPS